MDECMKSNHVQPQPARPESNFLVWTSHKSLSIIKWPVSRGVAIHFLSFKCFPPLRYTHPHRALVSVLFVCVCVSKSFLCDRFCLPPGHYVSGPLHVFCQALFKTESTLSNMATHFLSLGIFKYIWYSYKLWKPACLSICPFLKQHVVFLSFHPLPFLHRSFLLSQGQTLNTCSGMTDSVWRSIREEAKEGNHISSSAICIDSLSRLVPNEVTFISGLSRFH